MKRDKEVTYELKNTGRVFIRFWGREIKEKLNKCAVVVIRKIEEIK